MLAHNEVAAGAVRMFTWAPGQGFTSPAPGMTVTMNPTTADPRGAYGVVGLVVADLLIDAAHPGDELIVGTLSGDIIVYAADTMAEYWRSHVPGAIGMFNSIVVANLNPAADNLPELYVAGSFGLWRFTQPGEQP